MKTYCARWSSGNSDFGQSRSLAEEDETCKEGLIKEFWLAIFEEVTVVKPAVVDRIKLFVCDEMVCPAEGTSEFRLPEVTRLV